MYYFNSLLFKNLSALLGMTQNGLSIKVFGNNNRYRQKADNQYRILVSDIVKVCNELHISLSHFITLNPNSSYRDQSKEYVIDKKLFKPITFNSSSLNKMYGKDGIAGPMTQEDLAKKMGVSVPAIYLWINKDKCTIKLSQLIEMCNLFGVNMGEFIQDPNRPLPLNDVVVSSGRQASERSIQELIAAREIITNNQREIAELKKENKSLKLSIDGHRVAEESIPSSSGKAVVRDWIFNKELLDNLHNLLNISKAELWMEFGMKNPAVSYNNGNITIQMLIRICNRYQISSKHFFLRKNENKGIIREITFYQCDQFNPIIYHPEYISDIFGRESITEMTLEEVLSMLGYSEQKMRSWRSTEKSTLRVDDLVEMCNALSVTPSCFITDSNRTTAAYSVTQAEYYLEECRLWRQEAIRLKEEIKKLKKNKKQNIDIE